jgi:hypothetical protein
MFLKVIYLIGNISLMVKNHKKLIKCPAIPKNRGYSLIFAVMVGSMLMLIGASIISLATKERDIVTSSRESQVAFFSADAALECALYSDLQGTNGRSVFLEPYNFDLKSGGMNPFTYNFSCGNFPTMQITSTKSVDNQTVTNTFSLISVSDNSSILNNACVLVEVKKYDDPSDGDNSITEPDGYKVTTTIKAMGRNSACGTKKNIQVERAVEVSY